MARFFNFYPKTVYTSDSFTNGVDTVTNITARFGFEKSFKENSAVFYKYSIQDGDTPEILASKYYNDPEKHWMILLYNDIIDPQFDWPMQYETLIKFIDTKYTANGAANTPSQSGLTWAMSTNNVQAYNKIITKTSSDGTKFVETIQVDANTYANIQLSTTTYSLNDGSTIQYEVSKNTTTYFDYEYDLNEQKRVINIMKKDFSKQADDEFKRVINGVKWVITVFN